jgi:rare lipoprotein A
MPLIFKGPFRIWLCGLAVCCFLAGCATSGPPRRTSQNDPYEVFGKRYIPITDSANFIEVGIASWYGKDFHGKNTSSGEVYDMNGMTAAHKTLPLGTYVTVINLENGRSAILRVNDRGPFVDGRIIDLTHAAAEKLGIARDGTGRVAVVALDRMYAETQEGSSHYRPAAVPTDDPGRSGFSLQVGSFASRQNAERLRAEVAKKFDNAYITMSEDGAMTLYRVRVGPYDSKEAGEDALEKLNRAGYENVKMVTE